MPVPVEVFVPVPPLFTGTTGRRPVGNVPVVKSETLPMKLVAVIFPLPSRFTIELLLADASEETFHVIAEAPV